MKNYTNLYKRISIFSLFWFFFSGYFIIALLVESIPCPKWVASIDEKIPFIWWMIIPYYSYYILLIMPPFVIKNLNYIKLLTRTLIEISILCYIIYIFWPISSSSALESVNPNPLDFLHNFITFNFLHQNALPSMHVTVTVIIALAITKYESKFRNLMLIMILAIFLATFLIKQHYLMDSISGLLVGYIGFMRYNYLTNI